MSEGKRGRSRSLSLYQKTSKRRFRSRSVSLASLSDNKSWTSEPDCSFPSCTSKWDISHLESLRIFYDNHSLPLSKILDIVYEATGIFKPLSDAQKKRVKQVQDSISFSSSISELVPYAVHYYCTLTGLADPTIPDVFEDSILKNLDNDTVDTDDLSENAALSLEQLRVREFITSTLLMIQVMRSSKKPVPKAVFVDMFKDFVKMCGLIACDGSAWKVICEILQNYKITSAADVVITRRKEITGSSLDLLTLVSIVEVKNLGSYREEEKEHRTRPPSRPNSVNGGETKIAYEEPDIFRRIGRDVPGQHGGEILIHFENFGNDLKKCFNNYYYRPGMIVVGTEVTLTLLVCSFEHWNEIIREDVVEKKKSIIYYSEPKDLLRKEDRDILIESFVRLSNTT